MESLKCFFVREPSVKMHTDSLTRLKISAEPHDYDSMTRKFRPKNYEDQLKNKLEVEDLCQLAEGCFGTVFKANDRTTGKAVAVKVERSEYTTPAYTNAWVNRIMREVVILKELQGNDNIVAFHHHIFMGETPDQLPMYVAIKTEFLNYDLEEVTGQHSFNWHQMGQVADQIASAIKWMHNKGIVHHDLKPANLMCNRLASLDPSQIAGQQNFTTYKMIDFNLSRKYSTPREETQEKQCDGTRGYLSPEKQVASPTDPYNPFSADDFAFAATMVTLLMGSSEYYNQYEEYAGNVLTILQNNWESQDISIHESESTLYQALLKLLSEEKDRITVAQALCRVHDLE